MYRISFSSLDRKIINDLKTNMYEFDSLSEDTLLFTEEPVFILASFHFYHLHGDLTTHVHEMFL